MGTKGGVVYAVDIWTDCSLSERSDITSAVDVVSEEFESVEKQIQSSGLSLCRGYNFKRDSFGVIYEFLEVDLPGFLMNDLKDEANRENLQRDLGSSVLAENDRRRLLLRSELTAPMTKSRKMFDDIERYLRKHTNAGARNRVLATEQYRFLKYLPFLTAATLVVAWWMPLDPKWIIVEAVALMALLCMVLVPAYEVGWRALFRQVSTTISLGLFGIGAFGIGYAVCALLEPGSLGKGASTLGYAFLLSTGLGVAVGIVSESPIGSALILAHIQILLVLAGLISVIAVILRIRQATIRDRG